MATEYLIGNVKGIKGDKGETGAIGASPNLTIGTVTTGSSGTQANATITGITPNLELNLTIPKGDDGITPNEITGNAGTATKLQTARKINGVDFDGTKDISVEANNFITWNPIIKKNTWSRVCKITTASYTGTTFIINIKIYASDKIINYSAYITIAAFEVKLFVLPFSFYNGYKLKSFLRVITNRESNEIFFELKSGYPENLEWGEAVEISILFTSTKLSIEKYQNYVQGTVPPNYLSKEVDFDSIQEASTINISDTANNFTSTNVEGALLELASRIKALENK